MGHYVKGSVGICKDFNGKFFALLFADCTICTQIKCNGRSSAENTCSSIQYVKTFSELDWKILVVEIENEHDNENTLMNKRSSDGLSRTRLSQFDDLLRKATEFLNPMVHS